MSPGCRSVGLCRALSGLCRGSVGTLSGLCRLTTVGPLSASVGLSVGLCRPILTVTTRGTCRPLSTPVGLSRLCRSVGLSVCRSLSRPLSVSVEASVVILSDSQPQQAWQPYCSHGLAMELRTQSGYHGTSEDHSSTPHPSPKFYVGSRDLLLDRLDSPDHLGCVQLMHQELWRLS